MEELKGLAEYEIGSHKYKLPKEISYRQYAKITVLFQEAGIDTDDLKSVAEKSSTLSIQDGKIEADFRIGSILKALFEKDLLPKFFATVLIPVAKANEVVPDRWLPVYETDHLEDMFEIGDATALQVLQDFLSGRVSLISGILRFFTAFMEKNKDLIDSVNHSLPKGNEN